MKETKRKMNYIAPSIEMMKARVEKGFEISTIEPQHGSETNGRTVNGGGYTTGNTNYWWT